MVELRGDIGIRKVMEQKVKTFAEYLVELNHSDYPLGTIRGVHPPAGIAGVWKKMDGIQNLHPGSGIDYRNYGTQQCLFERVA